MMMIIIVMITYSRWTLSFAEYRPYFRPCFYNKFIYFIISFLL
jgi:hypothetical protein